MRKLKKNAVQVNENTLVYVKNYIFNYIYHNV